ncbi:MAG: hypothetical protein RIR26_338 [Pseudomonadota bacterium]
MKNEGNISILALPQMPRWQLLIRLAFTGVAFSCHDANADLFHYNNLLIGPRAAGLAGAYTALSEDTSGLFYNPGGMSLQNTSELSASVNTFYMKKNRFERVFGEKAFEESARGNLSSFFGFSKKVTPPLLGTLHLGIAFVNPDAALSDENTLIENEPAPGVIRYHRTANIRSGTSQFLFGVSKRLGKETGLGCTGSYLDVDELEQIYQDVVQGPYIYTDRPDTKIYTTLGQNVRMHLVARGGAVRCGIRTALGSSFKLGLSYQKAEIVLQRFEYDSEINKVFHDPNGQIITVENAANESLKGKLLRNVTRTTQDDFITRWPDEFRLGVAFQPHSSLLLSADLVRHGDGEGSISAVKRSEIFNAAVGLEWTLAQTLFWRTGFFTNSDATASRDLSSPYQRKEYIDYKGVSLSTGLKLRTGEYALHYTEQRGTGKAEKIVGNTDASSGRLQVLSISASQSFQ